MDPASGWKKKTTFVDHKIGIEFDMYVRPIEGSPVFMTRIDAIMKDTAK